MLITGDGFSRPNGFLSRLALPLGSLFLCCAVEAQSSCDSFNDPSLLLADDFSAASPLLNYTVQTPRGPQNTMDVLIAGEELVFHYTGGFGVAAAIHQNTYAINDTSISADVRFDTATSFIVSGERLARMAAAAIRFFISARLSGNIRNCVQDSFCNHY